jgi:integrase
MSHLIQHGGNYFFRYRFSPNLESVLGLSVFKLSLKTGSKRDAQRRAKRLNKVLQALLDPAHPPVISGDDLRRILTNIIDQAEANTASGKPIESPDTSPKLSDLIAEYLETVISKKTIGTQDKYGYALQEFIEAVGNKPISMVGHKDARLYAETLGKVPPNYRKHFVGKTIREVAALSHKRFTSPRTINDKVGILGRFFTWCINQGHIETNYAQGKKVQGGKPGFSTHEPYTLNDLREMFSHSLYVDDRHWKAFKFWLPLLGLFTGARLAELCQAYCKDIVQIDGIWCLHIRPSQKDENTRLKTRNANRIVPLHPVLVSDLGFVEFVNRVRRTRAKRIFPDCKPYRGKYGKDASAWFNDRFKPKIKITLPRPGFKKDFHSFRVTFINTAKQAGADIRMIEETAGHSDSTGQRQQSMSGDYYASPYNVRTRYEGVILKISYDIDFAPLASSHWSLNKR